VSKDKSRTEGVYDWEIIEMLLLKNIKPWEEIKKDDIDKLYERIDKKTIRRFAEKLDWVHLT
jgi:hypothetical protein